MKVVNVTYSQLTARLNATGLPLQYIEDADRYDLFLIENQISWEVILLKGTADATDFENTYKDIANQTIIIPPSPFASRKINSYTLHRRNHGVRSTEIASGQTGSIDLVIPYAKCILSSAEILGGKLGDIANLQVYDTAEGTYSGVPDSLLNQSWFNTNICDNFYADVCHYGIDLLEGMILKLTYTNNGTSAVTVGTNFVLHELASAA